MSLSESSLSKMVAALRPALNATDSSYLWLDYETTGTHRVFDRPVQFGAIRTNASLEQIGEPINLMCALPLDCLPSPLACVVHGIGPETQHREGMPEAEFAAEVFRHMNQPGTCNVGYNNFRFDDEFSRHLFFRTMREPYTFHFGGCSRWDILEVARACRALAPQGLEWPHYEDGRASYRLRDILAANGYEFGEHDAVEDARATLELARRIRATQPDLYDWARLLRNTSMVEDMLSRSPLAPGKPLLMVSGRMPLEQAQLGLVLPLADGRARSFTVAHLHEPDEALTPEGLEERLGDPEAFPPVSQVRSNRCPMLAPLDALSDERARELGIDVAEQLARAERLERHAPNMLAMAERYADYQQSRRSPQEEPRDPDDTLYSGGFASRRDRKLMESLPALAPRGMLEKVQEFEDSVYGELLFRHVARNWPERLTAAEQDAWRRQCRKRLEQGPGRTLGDYRRELQEVRESAPDALVQELEQWEQRVTQWLDGASA